MELPKPAGPEASASSAEATSLTGSQREGATSGPVVAPAEDVLAEAVLINDAHLLLAVDPQRTLTRCAEHQRRWPSGALALEREVLIIEALSALGRPADARARAVTFAQQNPTSIHLPRLRALVDDAR